MPWSVGRYNTATDFSKKIAYMAADAKLTSSRGQGYAPIAYAGYSYRDSNKFNFIKRYAGKFFQTQIDAYLKTPGTTFYYIAMFDEVQEGTAILKFAANKAESAAGGKYPFVTASIDGVDAPGDLYLTMAGHYAARARNGTVPPPSPSPSPSPSPTPSGNDSLHAGDTLASDQSLRSSRGKATLSMQGSDGNLVLYDSNRKMVWSSGTAGHPGAELRFQGSDGNLVVYAGSKAVWSCGPNKAAAVAKLGDDCNFVVSDANGKALWSSGTSCGGSPGPVEEATY